MSTTTTPVPETVGDPPTIPGWITWTLRVLAFPLAASAIVQPIVAGLFVTGDVAMLLVHALVAVFMALASLSLVVAAVLYWRPGRGSGRLVLRAGILFLLVAAQAVLGAFRILELHFPLAFVVAAAAVAFARWSVSPAARRAEAGR
ncbi:hypothetical protein LX16_1362 [Stackebrandtia albiflava]|uniref:Uncharacterized protein n=1 Tax=Stackebrandtia albiflava TaxID=406432 RepID=A0A562VCV9_9ACTN|nr:hypothetical protein [Stackebrandtia albiflava]TWJ15651.1 hypothetical protein LX16_1362 [Stackebrandtia albiflava]